MIEPRDRLIVALDVPNKKAAMKIVKKLRGKVGGFKIGLQLFVAAGPSIVRLVAKYALVFLDLKFIDIPNTVFGASESAVNPGNLLMFNMSCFAGSAAMRSAAEAARQTVRPNGTARPLVIGVTVLTSLDKKALAEMGIRMNPKTLVVRLAKLAYESGLDGVVASPKEIRAIRKAIPDPKFKLVIPGIRFSDGTADDQKRIATPYSAILDGADWIVVGRAITHAKNPAQAADRAVEEIANALAKRAA